MIDSEPDAAGHGIAAILRSLEVEHMDRIIASEIHTGTDYSELLGAEQRFAAYTNRYEMPSFANEIEYRALRLRDMDRFNALVREYLDAGLQRQGRRFADFQSMDELAINLRVPSSELWSPTDLSRVLRLIPILHYNSLHGSPPGEVATLSFPQTIPIVRSSSLHGLFRTICTLLVRRSYKSPTRDALVLRADTHDLVHLQMHARALVPLISLMFTDEVLSVPPLDYETAELMNYLKGSPEQVTEGATIGCLVTGYAYFEVLHEFYHILAGDWRKEADQLSVDDEVQADRFAAMCLLSGEHELPAAKVFALRGAHLFLALLGIAEFLFESEGMHPRANLRCKSLWDYSRASLNPSDLQLFDFLDHLEALVSFCQTPSRFGGVTSAGWIDRYGDPKWPDPFDSIKPT